VGVNTGRKQENEGSPRIESPCAIGFRAHSGWSALVILAGPLRAPVVIQRTRIELIDPAIAGSKQPFHRARDLGLQAGAKHVERCTDKAKQLAEQSVRAAIRFSLEKGYRTAAAGIVLGSGRALPDFASILGSHPLLHSAEGQLFREALADGAQRCGLPITGVK
jgi:hypothetical protein